VLNISQSVLATIIDQLDSAMGCHREWFDNFSQTLICRTPLSIQDLEENSHHNCKFGVWYYNKAHPRLREHPSFSDIGPLHKKMHRRATILLQQLQDDQQIMPEDYQRFSAALGEMRQQVSNLSNELQDLSRQLDPLTGVYTRGSMLTKLRNNLEKIKRGKFHCSIVMLDIDDFIAINEQYGHTVGDDVLHQIGSFLCEHIRVYDEVYRYGGDEFLILMEDCDKSVSKQSAERIFNLLNRLEIDVGTDALLNISASFGQYQMEAGTTVTESIACADRAMFEAKLQGKSRLVSWSDNLKGQPDQSQLFV